MRRGVLLFVFVAACGETVEPLTYEQALDPNTCVDCHPDHVREWSGSMHAYAGDDPIFRAMNARGQRETNGALGDFCVQCHAPFALAQGLTTDGTNLDSVPSHLRGVTCAFCHLVESVEDDHNNPLTLTNEVVMRGAFEAVDGAPHGSMKSPLHDRADPRSSDLCGSCHDIVTPAGVHIERTFLEWKGSLFAHETPAELQTCGRCHMQGRDGVAADVEGVPLRRITDHRMVGVDLALIDWPEKDDQRAAVQRMLDTTVIAQMCIARVPGGIMVDLDLENFAAGHSFPSGAVLDRRVWVELRATLGDTEVYASGVFDDATPVATSTAPDLWTFFDRGFDSEGNEAHLFWEIASYESNLLPAPTALNVTSPEYEDPHRRRTYMIPGIADRIEMKVNIRPVGLDVLDDLIESGDLDPIFRDRMETMSLAAANVVWTIADGETCIPEL